MCWDLDPVVGVVRDSGTTSGSRGLATGVKLAATATELGTDQMALVKLSPLARVAVTWPEVLDREWLYVREA